MRGNPLSRTTSADGRWPTRSTTAAARARSSTRSTRRARRPAASTSTVSTRQTCRGSASAWATVGVWSGSPTGRERWRPRHADTHRASRRGSTSWRCHLPRGRARRARRRVRLLVLRRRRPVRASSGRLAVVEAAAPRASSALRRFFSSSRRSCDAFVGFVARRGRWTFVASRSCSRIRSVASPRFRSCERSSCAIARTTGPSCSSTSGARGR